MKYLKIKDDVDLKELEKFGFKEINYINQRTHKYSVIIGKYEVSVITIGEDRTLHFNQMSVHNEIPSVIYDLIKADMVEVYEEN